MPFGKYISVKAKCIGELRFPPEAADQIAMEVVGIAHAQDIDGK